MNAAHFHLLINHVPILAAYFSIAVLVWGIAVKSEAIKKVAMVGFVVSGLFVIVVFQSGEAAEEIVEEISAVTHDSIEDHEEIASITQWLTILLGIGGAFGFYLIAKQADLLKTYLWVLLLYSMIAAGFLAYTAYEGGLIRHTEIENAAATANGGEATQSQQPEEEPEADDD